MSHKPLRYFVSSALLAGSLSACGGAEHPVNEPEPVVNEAEHAPEVNEHQEHQPEPEPETNPAEPEPEMSANPVAPEE